MTYQHKVVTSVLTLSIIGYLLYWFLPNDEKTYINIVSIIGFIFSILGLLIAFFQIASVKQIAEDTHEEVTKHIILNNKLLMISDLSSKAAMVNEIQSYLRDNKIEICILRMKDLKISLNSIKNQEQYSTLFAKKKFNDVFLTFNIDLNNIHDLYLNEKYKIDKPLIIKNLEELSTLLLSVEVKLKSPNYDK